MRSELVKLHVNYAKRAKQSLLESHPANIFPMLLSLLASYMSPFLLYIGLGLKQYYSSSTFFTCFSNISSLLQGLVCSPIRRPRVPLQFVQAYLDILCNIRVAFLLYPLYYYSFNIQLQERGILASFLSSAVAVRLYPPIILQRQAIQTFQRGLRSDLGGPFSDSLIAQILDPYVIVGRITAMYSRRNLQKYGPHIELTILDNAIYCTWPLRAAYAVYALYRSLLSTYTPNTLRP